MPFASALLLLHDAMNLARKTESRIPFPFELQPRVILWLTVIGLVNSGWSAQPMQVTALPDTGQTTRFTQTFGEDADFSSRGPAYVDNRDGTVTDSITGLIWQQTDGGEMTWERAKVYAEQLQLGGHQDWRLPTSLELFSLMDHSRNGPAMNVTYFPRSEARYWWTDSPRADDESKVWVVNTGGGIGAHAKRETISAGGDRPIHVRCVRGTSRFGDGPSLRDNGDGTVTDERTGLYWQKLGPDSELTWEESLKYCDTLKLAGQEGWRLPNIKELRSLSDDRLVRPSIDKSIFTHAQPDYYWSSTTQSNRPERAWFVDLTTGLVTYADKPERHWVIAVRGGDVQTASRDKPPPDPKLLVGSSDKGGKGKSDKGKNGKAKGKGDPKGKKV